MPLATVDRPPAKSTSASSSNLLFLLSNMVGIVTYLKVASRGWRIAEEHGAIAVSGEPFVWALALPVLGAFILVDLVWVGLLLRYGQPKRWLWWLTSGGLWAVALAVDLAHH